MPSNPRPSRSPGSLRAAGVLMAASLSAGCAAELPVAEAPAPAPTPRRPNLILVTLDDLDTHSLRSMPRVNALVADRGLVFANSFVTTPVCGPSRASIMTGRYVHNHSVWGNDLPDGGFDVLKDRGVDRSTIAVWLKEAGYRTALIGKFMNRYPGQRPGFDASYVPPGWDEWRALIQEPRKDDYTTFTLNENRTIVEYAGAYLTDVLADRAVEFVRASGAQPFFLWLTPYAPHLPAVPARRHSGAYGRESAPRPPSFNEADMSDKPEWYRGLSLLTPGAIRRIDDLYRDRLETLLAVDEAVERIVAALDSTGVLDDTFILFTSDNGYLLGQHRFPRGKGVSYEESIRVPLVVRGPGVPRGLLEHMVLNIDLAPTLADLAGARTPEVDGRSLAPLLRSSPPPASEWRKDFLVEHREPQPSLPSYFALRTRETVLVLHDTREVEYYHLGVDPYQLDSKHDQLVRSLYLDMVERLDHLRSCRGAACW